MLWPIIIVIQKGFNVQFFSGVIGKQLEWKEGDHEFRLWSEGLTGVHGANGQTFVQGGPQD